MMRCAVAFLVWLLAIPAFAQNVAIQGTVTRNGNTDPLSKATVELRTDDADALLDSVVTEEDGRFIFENVRPGRYRVAVKRAGYVRTPVSIVVMPGQGPAEVRLPMNVAGAIYGNVYDSKGAPLGNVLVQAFKATYPVGQRVLSPVQSVRTNDLGEFRFFWLNPGRYYLAALAHEAEPLEARMNVSGGRGILGLRGPNRFVFFSSSEIDPALGNTFGVSEPDDSPDHYVPVYYPGTTDDAGATAIDVRAGTEFGRVNIVVTPVREHHVRGVVIDGSTGKPPNYSTVSLDDQESRGMSLARYGAVETDHEAGTFDAVLLPGVHTLKADSSNGSGFVTIRVVDGDLNNVIISTSAGFNVAGRLVVEGASVPAADLEQLHLNLIRNAPQVRQVRATEAYSVPLPDGSFTLDASPGDFRVNIAPLLNVVARRLGKLPASLENAYVKSIRLGNVDVLNAGLHLDAKPQASLEVVVRIGAGNIDGATTGDALVALLPDLRSRTDLYRSVAADPQGRFRFEHIPPGEYKIFAWTEAEDGVWFDPEFMRQFENRGTPVRLAEGATVRVQVQP